MVRAGTDAEAGVAVGTERGEGVLDADAEDGVEADDDDARRAGEEGRGRGETGAGERT